MNATGLFEFPNTFAAVTSGTEGRWELQVAILGAEVWGRTSQGQDRCVGKMTVAACSQLHKLALGCRFGRSRELRLEPGQVGKLLGPAGQ